MGDQARQGVIEYSHVNTATGEQTPTRLGYPPPGNFPAASAAASRDPFVEWRERQQSAAAVESGASFPAAAAGPLPDLDAAFAEDLHDGEVMSDHGIGMVPGMTLEE